MSEVVKKRRGRPSLALSKMRLHVGRIMDRSADVAVVLSGLCRSPEDVRAHVASIVWWDYSELWPAGAEKESVAAMVRSYVHPPATYGSKGFDSRFVDSPFYVARLSAGLRRCGYSLRRARVRVSLRNRGRMV